MTGSGDQRFRQSMSVAVSRSATARANWARWSMVRRSVLRRSCPKFDSQQFGAFNGPAQSHGELGGPAAGGLRFAFAGDDRVVDQALREAGSGDLTVIAAVEPQGVDLGEQSPARGIIERRGQQDRVVAVRTRHGPADGYPDAVCEDRPLPSQLGAISRVLAGSLPSSRGFVQRPVDRCVAEVEGVTGGRGRSGAACAR